MRLYLSSYRLGNHADKLKALVNKPGARVAMLVEKEYEYVQHEGMPLKTFRDGDVYLVNGSERLVLD